LEQTSESPGLKTRNIKLTTPQEYFLNVVVPSRANVRIDDIEFVSTSQVKAYRVNTDGTRIIFYNLENTKGAWKING
jgi:hypothetical protein